MKAREFMAKTPYATADVELPSGRTVTLRRPPLRAWALAGTTPAFFTQDVREAWAKAVEAGQHEPEDAAVMSNFAHLLKVVRALAVWSFVEPRLEVGADGTGDAVCPSNLTEEDWYFLFKWFTEGSPEVAVEAVDGEVSIGEVRHFRHVQRW